jgi:hypothetical protein
MEKHMNYPANTKVIPLSRPCLMGSIEVTQVEMREPTVRDRILFEKQQGSALEKEMGIITSLCGIEKEDLLLLSAWDYSQMVETMNDFLLLPPAARAAKWKEQKEESGKATLKSASSGTTLASATGAV